MKSRGSFLHTAVNTRATATFPSLAHHRQASTRVQVFSTHSDDILQWISMECSWVNVHSECLARYWSLSLAVSMFSKLWAQFGLSLDSFGYSALRLWRFDIGFLSHISPRRRRLWTASRGLQMALSLPDWGAVADVNTRQVIGLCAG